MITIPRLGDERGAQNSAYEPSNHGASLSGAPCCLMRAGPRCRTNVLYERRCDVGSQVDYRVFEGFGHDKSTRENMPLMMEWTAARFAGDPATTTCE